jgi:transcriptional regulator with XRE-family HTH domain
MSKGGDSVLQLKIERLRRGWSLTKVTQMTGISASDISLIERGLRPAYPGWKKRLAAAFEMLESDLFNELKLEEQAEVTA